MAPFEPAILCLGGEHQLAGEDALGELAEHGLEREPRRRRQRRATERASERPRKAGVVRDVRCDPVHRSIEVLTVEHVQEQRDRVVAMNPRPPLAPRAEWTTRTPSERCQHRLQRAAAGGEYEAQAHADHAQAVCASSCSFALPTDAYARQEIITRRRALQKRLV